MILQKLLHIALTEFGLFEFIVIILCCLATAFLTFFIGSVRFWAIEYANLPKIWQKHRTEMRKELNDKDIIIEKQTKIIHDLQNEVLVRSVAETMVKVISPVG